MQSNEYVTFPDKVHYASGVLFRTRDRLPPDRLNSSFYYNYYRYRQPPEIT